MNRKKVIYISVLLVITVIASITYFSYAYLTRKDEHRGKINIRTGILEYKIEASEISNNQIVLSAGETKEIEIELTSLNNINSKYELYYEDIEDVEVGYLSEGDLPTGTINAKSSKTIKLVIRNNSNTEKSVKLGVKGGFVNNTLTLGNNENSIEETTNSCVVGTEYVFDYTGSVQTFTAPCTGTYKLETWGAQGGNAYREPSTTTEYDGGYGGYSTGNVILSQNQKLYVVTGEKGIWKHGNGNNDVFLKGGYNGGGDGQIKYTVNYYSAGSGGGATHIATETGLLSELQNNQSDILIVSGGGGGALSYYDSSNSSTNKTLDYLGSGGGYVGVSPLHTNYGTNYASKTMPTGGNQTTGGQGNYNGQFGTGASLNNISTNGSISGGGGGFYGGGSGIWTGASGGSSYIGNPNLTNKKMVCYNCQTSTDTNTYTETNTCASDIPTSDCSKIGNGYAKITYIGPLESGYTWDFDYTGNIQTFNVPANGTYKLEVWGAGGASGIEGNASKGGYSAGNIVLTNNQKIYIGVGSSAGYNGGGGAYGYGSGTGGGATHIALNNNRGVLEYYDSYREDIAIVAGGGGGGAGVSANSCCSNQKKTGGAGGGESGISANGAGGTQTTGNAFGKGGTGSGFRAGGGGGGWYGGKSCASSSNTVCTGGGGSGYIGGVTDGTSIAGNAAMPTHDGTSTMVGNTGNGYARITFLNN